MQFKPSPYSRKLPHFEIGQAYYHLIFRLREGSLTKREIQLVRQIIQEGNDRFYRLIAVQAMASHVHLVVQPLEGVKLQEIVRRIKGVAARKINLLRDKSESLWSDKYFDRVIRNQDDLNKTLRYLERNPVKAGVSDDGSDYQGWKFVQE